MPLDGINSDKPEKSFSLKEALDQIEEVLNAMQIERPFLRSAILGISIRLLNSNQSTVEEITWLLKGEGPDAFMNKYKTQEEAPTSTSAKYSAGRKSAMVMQAVRDPNNGSNAELPVVKKPSEPPVPRTDLQRAREAAKESSTIVSEATANIREILGQARAEVGDDDKSGK